MGRQIAEMSFSENWMGVNPACLPCEERCETAACKGILPRQQKEDCNGLAAMRTAKSSNIGHFSKGKPIASAGNGGLMWFVVQPPSPKNMQVVKSPALSPSNWVWRYGEIGQIPALYIDAEELFQRMQEVMVPSLTSSQGSGGILLDLKWLPFSAAGRDALPFEASNPQFFMKTNHIPQAWQRAPFL